MKIIRNGVEIELTANELRKAFLEEQHNYDMADIDYVCEVRGFDLSDEEKEVAVQRYRIDFESDEWFYALERYCKEIVNERQ